MTPSDYTAVAQIISGGIAGMVLFYIFQKFLSGDLHSNSEVNGLRKDVQDLKDINKDLSRALEAANDMTSKVLDIQKGGG